ncbi:hypothetical protein DFR50_12299 [Roseiarcus fermentans]|uniref:Crescentin coiled-coil domain-containing protein n=1 Tax=Roseiarcus fermentans TaxID=1473586 RepID=A0A366F3N5_9HYPH|nr:hypothetical protein [Roseiarcus fermentans]RBP09262.1 hypothetical protein DFR50_12299 [Roseiarcus fermentans]
MSAVWDKLFGNFQPPANDALDESGDDQGVGAQGPSAASAPAPDSAPKSQTVARTFDSIGRRNEALRAHLFAVEASFRDIEAIRAQFHESLIPIDQTLSEIERTKVAHVEAERKFETLTAAHDKLKNSHAGLTLERNAMLAKQDELSGRLADLERGISSAEAASSEARAALADRSAKLERVERELEDNRRRLQTVTEQLPALRTEFAAKEKKLQEVEQHRASLHDQTDLLTQENRALKARIEEFVANVSKLGRKLSELESRRDDLSRRVDELETALAHETAAHAKSKSAQLDAAEAQRLAQTSLREELSALHARHEAAEKLLSEARTTLRDREASIRNFEQRALEHSLATKSKDATLADLDKDLAALRVAHAEVDTARITATERSSALAKALEDREIALQRAEQRIEVLEARVAEQNRIMLVEREAFEQRAAKLKDQLEAESASRAFAEGALQSARQDRGGRRPEADPPAAEANVVKPDAPAQERVARFRG